MTTNDFLAANFRDIHSYEDFFKSDRRDFLKRVGGGIFIFMAVNEALLSLIKVARAAAQRSHASTRPARKGRALAAG